MELSEWLVNHELSVKQEIDNDMSQSYYEFVTTDYELSPDTMEHRKKNMIPRVCQECGKSFSRADSLKRHERLYCRVKSEIKCCIYCGEKFVKPQSLRQHINAVHAAELRDKTSVKDEHK
ncbi:histone-lysine N-methyltransferase PRDM9-like [Odontomachus brunneus]|uniref:histone-lysine N-methyltransferase PRDM9-like n=1 Tax=Odontomachus brunneus TaxID=486640 RepID=UPI0013F1D751|nr:histone-lysine N-methyltransferase PRDM9-like [Odontomachus brunneus]